ncbi:MAG TPA: hypothetical protein VIH22_19275, partial [Cyclobacteriaceae bacterium]
AHPGKEGGFVANSGLIVDCEGDCRAFMAFFFRPVIDYPKHLRFDFTTGEKDAPGYWVENHYYC